MHYNGFYYRLFSRPMKRVIAETYGKQFASDIMKKSRPLYKKIVREADDLGKDNPMAYNELFALAFIAPYLASGKTISPETVKEMMRQGLLSVKWYFSMVDLNTAKGKAANKKSIMSYVKWYTPEREKAFPTSFKVDFEGQPYEGACYYRITRCPICLYCEKLGCKELMPLLCDLDNVMINLQHGILHRRHTIAEGAGYCDYFITGDHEENF